MSAAPADGGGAMIKCVYCKKRATGLDELGLDACPEHTHEADEYVANQMTNTGILDKGWQHPYSCTCEFCKRAWQLVGPDPDTGKYGPFGDSLGREDPQTDLCQAEEK